MPLELFTNAANPTTARTTTLGAAMLAGDLTLTVASSTGFPAAVAGVSQFRVLVGSEIMIVTNVSGLVWTVIRGAELTTAAGYAVGVAVNATITAGALANAAARPVLLGATTGVLYSGTFLADGATNTGTVSRGFEITRPLFFPAPFTCNQITFNVKTAAAGGSTVRLGVFDGETRPSRLIFDSGLIASDVVGDKVLATSLAITPATRQYYACMIVSVDTTFECVNNLLMPAIGNANAFGAGSSSFEHRGAYVAFTDTTFSGSLILNTRPVVHLRFQAA